MHCALNETNGNKESIWTYPTPPLIESVQRHIQVLFNGVFIAETERTKRVLETGHPPIYYIPPEDVKIEYLTPGNLVTLCKWIGLAHYANLEVAERYSENAAWYYPNPNPPYIELENYIAFYAHLVDACYIDEERVIPEPFSLYGGWITHDIIGPFQGDDISL